MRANADVVVVFSLQLLPIAPLLRLAGFKGAIVADIHDAPLGMDRVLARVCLWRYSGVVAVSEFTAAHLRLRSAAVLPRPIPVGVGPAEPSPADANGTTHLKVGIAGRLDPEKRIEVAIAAVSEVGQDVSLNVYGEGFVSSDKYVRELRESAARTGNVTFRGRVSPDTIFREIDALVVANEREPSGRTAGEAMAAGRVVLAPDRGGSREYFTDRESGFEYAALDHTQLADHIRTLIANPDLRRRVADAANKKVFEERRPDVAAPLYFNYLSAVASGAKGGDRVSR